MRKLLITSLLILIVLVGHSQTTKNFIDQPYIEVNGNADTSITPDEIYLKIVISESDTKNRVSLEDQEIKMVDALKALGIETEKDLTTSDASSNFKYYFLKGTDVIKTKEYILKVSDAVMLTKVLLQLEGLNISNTSIDHVDYSKLEDLKNFMRTKAVENAKTRAIALTRSLNQTVGAAIYIADSDVGNSNMLSGRVAGVVVTGYGISRNKQQPQLPNIQFEKIQVNTNVNVKFILK